VIKWIKRRWRIWIIERDLKRIKKTMGSLPSTFSSSVPIDTSLMTLSSGDKDIFKIDANGNAVWCNEATYDEVAETFLNAVNWKIEDEAGIRISRVEWENKITAAIIKESEENGGSLTTEELTNVIKKCIMYDRLKGFDDGPQ